jgi:hypothetical protein
MPSVVAWVIATSSRSPPRTAATPARASSIRCLASSQYATCARPKSRSYASSSAIAEATSAGSGPAEPVFSWIAAESDGSAARTAASLSTSDMNGETTALLYERGPGLPMTGFARPELLASTEWLADELSRPDVRIVDCRWRPDGTGQAVFDAGHIPGATYLDWRTELNEAASDEPGEALRLAGPESVLGFMRRAGVGAGELARPVRRHPRAVRGTGVVVAAGLRLRVRTDPRWRLSRVGRRAATAEHGRPSPTPTPRSRPA